MPLEPLIPLALLSSEAIERRRAVEALSPAALATPEVAYALRRLLASDPDVATRALAAAALGRVHHEGATAWLVAALADVSPVVRDQTVRALARREGPSGGAVSNVASRAVASIAVGPLCELARTDTTWFVRRAALYAIGVVAGVGAIEPARAALSDPFWRVRHAAVQVLAVCGNREPARRDEILAAVPDNASAGEYLAALWGPTLVGDDPRPAMVSKLPSALLDRDPAVVTARLAALPAPLGPDLALAIVELLCDPHVPLRELAARRLIEANEIDAFAAALHWLDEPRIPHVAVTVVALLDGLGNPARVLAERALAAPARPGASKWAIGWTVGTHDTALAPLAWQRAVELDACELAMPLATDAELAAILAEDLAPMRITLAAADELLRRPDVVRARILATAPMPWDAAVRLRFVAAASATPATTATDAAACDPCVDVDPLVRALAFEAAGANVSSAMRAWALRDPDPAVREAVVAHAPALDLAAQLETERDPWVRRAASHTLVNALRGDALLGAPRAALIAKVAITLTADADAWIRACACELLDAGQADHATRIGTLANDRSPMVQAAIADVLARLTDAQLTALITTTFDGVATWLAAGSVHDVPAATYPTANAINPAVANAAVVNPAVANPEVANAEVANPEVANAAVANAAVIPAERRGFGRSGVSSSALVISGAFDLQPGSLRVAAAHGVDTMFWEPSYAGMTRFLRGRRDMQVVTGSYHADAAWVARDVDLALRKLRRETLDVFLLFWARSDARLDREAFAALAALQRAGKVRAIGFSTHDRALAMRAIARDPWDVVMTRHSAAHPGIEDAMLTAARVAGAGVLTFSALCYGRMVSGQGAPTATDCYRYSLAQPGVTATISAPRRHRELVENLEVVARPALAATDLVQVRTHGVGVRVESQRFNALIRQPTRDAAAMAMAMLESELATREEIDAACITPAALQRSLHSRGRGRASLLSAMLRRGRL